MIFFYYCSCHPISQCPPHNVPLCRALVQLEHLDEEAFPGALCHPKLYKSAKQTTCRENEELSDFESDIAVALQHLNPFILQFF